MRAVKPYLVSKKYRDRIAGTYTLAVVFVAIPAIAFWVYNHLQSKPPASSVPKDTSQVSSPDPLSARQTVVEQRANEELVLNEPKGVSSQVISESDSRTGGNSSRNVAVKPSPPLPTASVLSGKWEVLLAKSSSSETRDRIEMTLSNQGNTSLLGNRIYIRGSGGIGDKIEIEGSWDPAQRMVELKEHMDASRPWEATTRGVFIGTLSEDGDRLEGTWTRYSGGQTDKRNFKRVR